MMNTKNFDMIGSMGKFQSFALGIAKSNPNKKIIILDGDELFMNLGATACIGFYNPSNIVHIILDNFLVTNQQVVKIQFQKI